MPGFYQLGGYALTATSFWGGPVGDNLKNLYSGWLVMALGSTIYKVELDISDLDRSYYASHSLTVARHPSETESRLMLRLLAFSLWGSPTLRFIDGLSRDGEPALMDIDDTGWTSRWIELGVPAVKLVRKAAGRSSKVIVLAYGESRISQWWQSGRADFEKVGRLGVYWISDDELAALAGLCGRHMRLAVTVQDKIAYVADALGHNIEIDVKTLKTPRAD